MEDVGSILGITYLFGFSDHIRYNANDANSSINLSGKPRGIEKLELIVISSSLQL
jgi:hypothetical protein